MGVWLHADCRLHHKVTNAWLASEHTYGHLWAPMGMLTPSSEVGNDPKHYHMGCTKWFPILTRRPADHTKGHGMSWQDAGKAADMRYASAGSLIVKDGAWSPYPQDDKDFRPAVAPPWATGMKPPRRFVLREPERGRRAVGNCPKNIRMQSREVALQDCQAQRQDGAV